MNISLDIIVEYFRHNGASEKCPFCGQEDWGVSAANSEQSDMLSPDYANVVIVREDKPTGHELSIIPFTCLTCGFVRFQSLIHLQAWVSSERKINDTQIGS